MPDPETQPHHHYLSKSSLDAEEEEMRFVMKLFSNSFLKKFMMSIREDVKRVEHPVACFSL